MIRAENSTLKEFIKSTFKSTSKEIKAHVSLQTSSVIGHIPMQELPKAASFKFSGTKKPPFQAVFL
jgi:hypothetical protein